MNTTREFNEAAAIALTQNEPVRALELLDQPWMLGLPMTAREARANALLEDGARELGKPLAAKNG